MKTSMTAVLACAAGSALGQINAIPQFTGQFQEGFEQYPTGQFVAQLTNAFGGNAVFNQIGGSQGLGVTTGWFFHCGIGPHGGSKFMAGTSRVTVEWVFDEPVRKVGGFFGTNADAPDADVSFFDANNALLATVTANVPLCGVWVWNGWEATGNPIKRLTVTARHSLGGHIMHDDLEVEIGPGPCYADCDTTTGPRVLDIFDFLCFQNRYDAGAPYACDCDTTTGVGVCDIFDFLCFQNAFDQGCP